MPGLRVIRIELLFIQHDHGHAALVILRGIRLKRRSGEKRGWFETRTVKWIVGRGTARDGETQAHVREFISREQFVGRIGQGFVAELQGDKQRFAGFAQPRQVLRQAEGAPAAYCAGL